jgi:putative ABC transport system permease protein
MRFTKQFGALLRMSVASVPRRLGLVFTIVIGVGSAVGVLVSMLAMGAGAQQQAMGNVRADRVVVMNADAQGPLQSRISTDNAALIRELPGIRRNAKGEPIAIQQALVFVQARKKTTGRQVGFPLAGVSAGLADYMPELHLTSGRMFRPGLHELIASNMCERNFADFAVGDKRSMRGGEWTVVGNFDVGREGGTCVVFTDADTILSAFGRSRYNQVNVMLQSTGAFTDLTKAIDANPMLRVKARREAEVTKESLKQLIGILNFVSYFVGAIMAIAGTLGAANSLYAAVDGRRREMATLRAIGFSTGPIIAAVLSESIMIALMGAGLGAGFAWLLFNGFTASPFGFSFHLAVTLSVLALGTLWALAMGLVGGFLPALRAARMPVAAALRAV